MKEPETRDKGKGRTRGERDEKMKEMRKEISGLKDRVAKLEKTVDKQSERLKGQDRSRGDKTQEKDKQRDNNRNRELTRGDRGRDR